MRTRCIICGMLVALVGSTAPVASILSATPHGALAVTRTIPIPARVLDGPVASKDGWAYLIDGQHVVYAVSPAGRVIKRKVSQSYAVLPGAKGTAVVVSRQGTVEAYSFVQHRRLWSTTLGSVVIVKPILLPNGTVNIIIRDGLLISLAMRSGSVKRRVPLWARDQLHGPGETYYFVASGDSTYLYFRDRDTLYGIGAHGVAFAFNPNAWLRDHAAMFGMDNAASTALQSIAGAYGGMTFVWFTHTPTLIKPWVMVLNNSQRLSWSVTLPAVPDEVVSFRTASLPDGSLVLTELGGFLLRLAHGRVVWQAHDRQLVELSAPSVVVSKSTIYVGSHAGLVAAVSARDGKVRWRVQLPVQESVLRIAPSAGGKVWAATRDHLFALSPAQ